MDALIALMTTASTHSGISEQLQKHISALVETRTSEKWATAEVENAKAKEEAAKILAKPAPRKSAAIRIEVQFKFSPSSHKNSKSTHIWKFLRFSVAWLK